MKHNLENERHARRSEGLAQASAQLDRKIRPRQSVVQIAHSIDIDRRAKEQNLAISRTGMHQAKNAVNRSYFGGAA